jgi:hypothetical protein
MLTSEATEYHADVFTNYGRDISLNGWSTMNKKILSAL